MPLTLYRKINMKIKPIGPRILIKKIAEEQKKGAIILSTIIEKNLGVVVEVSEDLKIKGINPGDKIKYQYAYEFDADYPELFFVEEMAVIAVITNE
jgi:co-chaperonin GroES (HSP10)